MIVLERRNSYELSVFEKTNCNFLFLFPTKFGRSGKLRGTIYSDMLHEILKYDNVLGPWFKGLLFERLIGFFNLTIGSSEKFLLGCMARNSQLFLGCLCYMGIQGAYAIPP